jgi:hypothetical protein
MEVMFGLLVLKKYGGRKRCAACWKIQGVRRAQDAVQAPARV